MYKCPFCGGHARSIEFIRKHIKHQHEDIDHWALWVNEKER